MILGLDLETNHLDTTIAEITEVGAVLWDEKNNRPIQIFSSMIHGPKIPQDIQELTGLTDSLLILYGVPLNIVCEELALMIEDADCIVAHNGTNFDKPIFERVFAGLPKKHWIDTSVDVPYPPQISTRKLVHLAAEHGFLNPFAHRAVFDVMTMLNVLSRYDFKTIEATSRVPNVNIQALVSFELREKAKARGFRWHAEDKKWIKTIKQNQVEAEKLACSFPIDFVEKAQASLGAI